MTNEEKLISLHAKIIENTCLFRSAVLRPSPIHKDVKVCAKSLGPGDIKKIVSLAKKHSASYLIIPDKVEDCINVLFYYEIP